MPTRTCRAGAAMLLGLVAAPAHGASVTFCAEYQVDYEDSDLTSPTETEFQGDYFASNSNKVAKGITILIERDDGVKTEKHTDWNGTDVGCADFTMDPARTFTVRLVANLEVNGNDISVRNNPTADLPWAGPARDSGGSLMTSWSPPSGTSTHTITTANTHDAWNVAAAAGHAMSKSHSAGRMS